MFTFFRRLIGTDPIQRAVNRRFRNGLNGFDKRAEEIEGIEGQLASIISTVEKKQDRSSYGHVWGAQVEPSCGR